MVNILIILANVLVFFMISEEAKNTFGLNILFFDGYYGQIFSTMFIHGNLTHLILNMLALYQFGFILEKYLGYLRYTLLYFLGGVACSLLSLSYVYIEAIYFQTFINTVGASGAICVLIGFYAFLDKRSTKGLIVFIVLMSFLPMFMGINIAWYSHIFGFICGYVIARLRILQ